MQGHPLHILDCLFQGLERNQSGLDNPRLHCGIHIPPPLLISTKTEQRWFSDISRIWCLKQLRKSIRPIKNKIVYLKITKFSTVSMRNSPLRECQVQPKLTLCWCHSWTWKRSFKIKMMVKRIFGERQHCHWWQTFLVEPWWQGWILPYTEVPKTQKDFQPKLSGNYSCNLRAQLNNPRLGCHTFPPGLQEFPVIADAIKHHIIWANFGPSKSLSICHTAWICVWLSPWCSGCVPKSGILVLSPLGSSWWPKWPHIMICGAGNTCLLCACLAPAKKKLNSEAFFPHVLLVCHQFVQVPTPSLSVTSRGGAECCYLHAAPLGDGASQRSQSTRHGWSTQTARGSPCPQ